MHEVEVLLVDNGSTRRHVTNSTSLASERSRAAATAQPRFCRRSQRRHPRRAPPSCCSSSTTTRRPPANLLDETVPQVLRQRRRALAPSAPVSNHVKGPAHCSPVGNARQATPQPAPNWQHELTTATTASIQDVSTLLPDSACSRCRRTTLDADRPVRRAVRAWQLRGRRPVPAPATSRLPTGASPDEPSCTTRAMPPSSSHGPRTRRSRLQRAARPVRRQVAARTPPDAPTIASNGTATSRAPRPQQREARAVGLAGVARWPTGISRRWQFAATRRAGQRAADALPLAVLRQLPTTQSTPSRRTGSAACCAAGDTGTRPGQVTATEITAGTATSRCLTQVKLLRRLLREHRRQRLPTSLRLRGTSARDLHDAALELTLAADGVAAATGSGLCQLELGNLERFAEATAHFDSGRSNTASPCASHQPRPSVGTAAASDAVGQAAPTSRRRFMLLPNDRIDDVSNHSCAAATPSPRVSSNAVAPSWRHGDGQLERVPPRSTRSKPLGTQPIA